MRGSQKKPRATVLPERFVQKRNLLEQHASVVESERQREVEQLKSKPAEFFEQILGFEPFDYQAELIRLFVKNQFLAARWCRQSGKSWTISALLLNYALNHDDSYIAVVGPSWRQTKLNIRRISYFLRKLNDSRVKAQKTKISFPNGSVIEAFPNNPDTIRGPTLDVVWWDECLPGYVLITLADGSQIPISQVRVGQYVLSYNLSTGKVESKKVLRTLTHPLAGKQLVHVFHDYGYLDCTSDHKILVSGAYKEACSIAENDKCLYLDTNIMYRCLNEENSQQKSLQRKIVEFTRAAYSRLVARRFVFAKTKGAQAKRLRERKSFIKTSRISSVEIFDPKEFCEDSSCNDSESRLGQRNGKIQYSVASCIHRHLQSVLRKWAENPVFRLVVKNPFASCVSSLVHGRWVTRKRGKNEDQHVSFFKRRACASAKLAENSLETKLQNCASTRTRLLSELLCAGQGAVLSPNQRSDYSGYAVQAASGSEMPGLWSPVCSNQQATEDMQRRMQKATSQIICEPVFSKEEVVYDIEVEDNHNFFANGVLVKNCNFTANDSDLYDAILFTLGTTDGKLVCTSTPWNTDSLFWRMCNHKDFSDFARHHVTWEQAQEPNGPLRKKILEKIKRQFGEDQMRWRREMEAEWAEDEDTWLPQSLIAQCIGTEKNCGEDLQPWDTSKGYSGELFGGIDLAQTRDYCVLAVNERVNDVLRLRHLKIFRQPTKYATVIGYMKMLQDRWEGFQRWRVDNTREGPSIISDMEEAGISNVEGVTFTTSRKSEMASLLKQRMMNQRFYYPFLTWEKPYRGDICSEMNIERFELRRDGAVSFSHPHGTHDDVWWAVALAVYATVEMKKFDLEGFVFG